jgi:nicotinamide-nucleotide amidase
MVKLRLTGRSPKPGMEAEVEAEFDMLKQQLTDVLVVDDDKTLEQVVAGILLEREQTLSTAESCTGGYIAHLLTSIPGSSAYYRGGAVSYANDVKEKMVGVRHETLLAHGAVSRETVLEMARGIRQLTGSDFAISTSGIMGPDGGTPEKPVGTVWVGLAAQDRETACHFQFRFDRQRNMELTAAHGLNALRKFMLD